MKKLLTIFIFSILLLIPTKALAINEVNIFLFYKENCNICDQEKIYLQALQKRYPNMRIYSYNVDDIDNYNLMSKAKSIYNQKGDGVPFTVIGDKAYLGFSQGKKALFQKYVYEYSKKSYTNKLGKELGITYRNDLEGTVEEYKNNDSYQIEESSGRVPTPIKKDNGYDKYKVTIYLVGAGISLALIAGIIYMVDRKRG